MGGSFSHTLVVDPATGYSGKPLDYQGREYNSVYYGPITGWNNDSSQDAKWNCASKCDLWDEDSSATADTPLVGLGVFDDDGYDYCYCYFHADSTNLAPTASSATGNHGESGRIHGKGGQYTIAAVEPSSSGLSPFTGYSYDRYDDPRQLFATRSELRSAAMDYFGSDTAALCASSCSSPVTLCITSFQLWERDSFVINEVPAASSRPSSELAISPRYSREALKGGRFFRNASRNLRASPHEGGTLTDVAP